MLKQESRSIIANSTNLLIFSLDFLSYFNSNITNNILFTTFLTIFKWFRSWSVPKKRFNTLFSIFMMLFRNLLVLAYLFWFLVHTLTQRYLDSFKIYPILTHFCMKWLSFTCFLFAWIFTSFFLFNCGHWLTILL